MNLQQARRGWFAPVPSVHNRRYRSQGLAPVRSFAGPPDPPTDHTPARVLGSSICPARPTTARRAHPPVRPPVRMPARTPVRPSVRPSRPSSRSPAQPAHSPGVMAHLSQGRRFILTRFESDSVWHESSRTPATPSLTRGSFECTPR